MKIDIHYEKILPYTVEAIWPVLSDTASMNKKLGLAPMSFETKNGVRHGQQKMFGNTIHWTEAPWEWRQFSWLENERVYSNGLFESVRGRFEVESFDSGQSTVSLHFFPIYRSKWLAPLLNWATKRILRNLVDAIEETLKQNREQNEIQFIKSSFEDWLISADDIARAKIAPKEVASLTHSTWQNVFSSAIDKRELALRFEAVCPHCRGGKLGVPRLTELPQKVFCESCEIEFAVNTQDSIEVSFRDNTIPSNLLGLDFCSADVTHKPAIVFQRLGGAWTETFKVAPGVYSLKKKGETRSISVKITDDLPDLEFDLDRMWSDDNEKIIQSGPMLTFVSRGLPSDSVVMFEQLSKVRGALFATELMAESTFVDLLPAESLVTTFPLEMGERTVLFTDVVGSTEMYYELGDTVAFQLVRESFILIGEVARRHNGVLVKTIGDATMYAFMNPVDALKTAIEIQLKNKSISTKLRVTLHHGSCLAVGTKDGQDFFGDTINVCAKFQATVGADQISFDRSLKGLMASSDWDNVLAGFQLEEVSFSMKGSSPRDFDLYRLTV